jgi:hypothetical protein
MEKISKSEVRAFIKESVIEAEKRAREFAQKNGEKMNYPFAYGYLSARILSYVEIYESSQDLLPDPEA